MKVEAEFDFNDRLHKVTQRIIGIPVGVPGTCWVTTKLEHAQGVTQEFSYPLEIIHKTEPLAALPLSENSKMVSQ